VNIRFSSRAIVAIAVMVGTSACASTSPNVFERHTAFEDRVVVEAASQDREVCPVVVSNGTGHLVEAAYRQRGLEKTLGRIPAGRSLTFGVQCDSGPIEAFAESDFGGLLGEGNQYRTMAALDLSGQTVLSFTLTDRIR